MASPVRAGQQGEPDSLIQTWLGTYTIATPGVVSSTNASVRRGEPGTCRIHCQVEDQRIEIGSQEVRRLGFGVSRIRT